MIPFYHCPRMMSSVAPSTYAPGAASILPSNLQAYPPQNWQRITFWGGSAGFWEALSGNVDYFFGLSLVLATIGDKFVNSAGKMDLRPLLKQPRALMRLSRGVIKSRLARRNLLPRDLWRLKGIISSGLDSSIYKEKIKDYWGRYPLDIYANTEGGVIATQTWDYSGMTFIPNLNFLEFIPEQEHLKSRMDHNYKPRTILLDEVKPGNVGNRYY